MAPQLKIPIINREISWLSFNERVLQEAADSDVPLIERLRFLGIFSNNRDEFFRVRVATLRRMVSLGKRDKSLLDDDPEETLEKIHKIVIKQQYTFKKLYKKLYKELKSEGIFIVNERELLDSQEDFVRDYFINKVRPALIPIILDNKREFPFLKDKEAYLFVNIIESIEPFKNKYALIEIPNSIPRFIELPKRGDKKFIILLDDVIRYCLDLVFSYFDFEFIEAYTIKLTRDAELDIDDDISKSIVSKLSKSLENRKSGDPVRFVYDEEMPENLLNYICKRLKIGKKDNLIPGGRYHNSKDYIGFPNIGALKLEYPKLPPLSHPEFELEKSPLSVIKKEDVLLCYPFQSFNSIIDILREAAIDPYVKSVKINLYRVAKDSKVINALISAVKNGKTVTVVVELRARFDEEANIYWANKLQEAGAKVIFGVEGLKVHSKLILITRKKGKNVTNYAHIGTGNFHEGTAKMYGDISLLTSDVRITNEVEKLFDFFDSTYKSKRYNHLLVSPNSTRRKLISLINTEIKNAQKDKDAFIILKLNNLVDNELIKKLYEASKAGVKIKLIIRGICSLVPGVKGISENIEAISIIDRFLEHARVLIFCNGGDERYFISSADWMVRNLDRRIEVTTPVYNKKLQTILRDLLDIQWKDNTKARVLGKEQRNIYKEKVGKEIRSQVETYKYFKNIGQ